MSSRTWWVAGLLLVVLSLGLRVAYVEATPRAQRIHDAYDYDGHARAIAATGSFSPTLAHRRPSAFRPPGYPYVLGAVYRLTGVRNASDDTRAHVAQLFGALIGALTVGMIALLAAQLWGRLAAISGNDGDGPQVATLRAAAAAPGRHARLFGGGNEMVIIYGTAEELRGAVR